MLAWPATGAEWEIDIRDDSVTLSITGDISPWESQRFVFWKENCDRVTQYFNTLTAKPVDFEKLVGRVLLIEFNGTTIGARLEWTYKVMAGHMLYSNLGDYGKDVLLGYLKKNPKMTINFVDGDGYKASDYFDVPLNEWSTAGISEAFENAHRACALNNI